VKSRVLVIEDERPALQALYLLLTDENYDVLQAECGQTGLTLARQEKPDLILLDIRLPDLNGLRVLEQIRHEKTDHVPIRCHLVFHRSWL
jgi:two-component system alkaline phosphatase synthesis response regulator PhoP